MPRCAPRKQSLAWPVRSSPSLGNPLPCSIEALSLFVSENGAERMVAGLSLGFRDGEGLAQQRLVKGARRGGHGNLQLSRCLAS